MNAVSMLNVGSLLFVFYFNYNLFHKFIAPHIIDLHNDNLLHRPPFTKFFTPAKPLFPTVYYKTNRFPSFMYYHQGEKGSADLGFCPCDPPYFKTGFSTPKLTNFRCIFNEVKSTWRFKFNQ